MHIEIEQRTLPNGSHVFTLILDRRVAMDAVNESCAHTCANLLKQVIEHNTTETVDID